MKGIILVQVMACQVFVTSFTFCSAERFGLHQPQDISRLVIYLSFFRMFHFLLSFHRYSIACPGMDLNLSNNVWFDDEAHTEPTTLDPEAEKMCMVSYKKGIEAS